MKITRFQIGMRSVISGLSALSLVSAVALGNAVLGTDVSLIPIAHADEDGGGGKGKQSHGPGAGGGHGKGSSDIGGSGQGQGGPSGDSDAKGPRAQQPDPGTQGGKPAWAQEGVPSDAELGRLNVARAPEHVLDRAVAEVLENTWTDAMATLYVLTAEAAAALISSDYDNVVRIDSPLENLGLYKDVLIDGVTQLPVTPASTIDLAAILLGSASDKEVEVTETTVTSLSTIFGLTLSDADVTAIAEKADAVRTAILAGHG